MGALIAGLFATLPIAILPAESNGLPAKVVRAAELAVARALPAPWTAAKLDEAAARSRLEAAGPACRLDPRCLCSAVALGRDAKVIDVSLERLDEGGLWAADVRLIACEGRLIARRAEALAAAPAALERWIAEALPALLKGQDLGALEWSPPPIKPAK